MLDMMVSGLTELLDEKGIIRGEEWEKRMNYPFCNGRIDELGLCTCGAGGD